MKSTSSVPAIGFHTELRSVRVTVGKVRGLCGLSAWRSIFIAQCAIYL